MAKSTTSGVDQDVPGSRGTCQRVLPVLLQRQGDWDDGFEAACFREPWPIDRLVILRLRVAAVGVFKIPPAYYDAQVAIDGQFRGRPMGRRFRIRARIGVELP